MSAPSRPPSAGLRRAVERRSGPLLVVLSGLPRPIVPLVSLALLVGGLSLPPAPAAGCLGVLALLVGWLSYLSWPVLLAKARLIRLATAGLVLVALVQRLLV